MLSNVVVVGVIVKNVVFVRRHHTVRAHAVTDGSHELQSVLCPVVVALQAHLDAVVINDVYLYAS